MLDIGLCLSNSKLILVTGSIMKVSELAKSLMVTADTVRYYTRNAFLSPNKNAHNGYKYYSFKDQKRLSFIISARQLGFTVKDIEKILVEADKGHSACQLARALIEKKLRETERQFQQTLALRNRLTSAIADWQSKPNKAPTSEMICHLIEGFDEGLESKVQQDDSVVIPLSKKEA